MKSLLKLEERFNREFFEKSRIDYMTSKNGALFGVPREKVRELLESCDWDEQKANHKYFSEN